MVKKRSIDDFLTLKSFAVVGVSRDNKKFGNSVYRMLKERGVKVYPVNPNTDRVDGERCYSRLTELPEKVEGVVIVVPPKQTEAVVKEAAEVGIQNVWMQQGAESRSAIQFCEQYGIDAVHGECIFMFVEPVISVHKFHRWTKKLFHKLPQ
jgi:predicted CoA-binding protein